MMRRTSDFDARVPSLRDCFDDQTHQRVDAIRSLGIMDSDDEADFDEIAAYASEICGTPVALITLVDGERQWAKAAHGTDQRHYTLTESICAHGFDGTDFLEIEDTLLDERTRNNPLVRGETNLRYYGGAVLKLGDTTPIGALCVLDTQPRKLPESSKRLLRILARQVTRRMELRRALTAQETLAREVDHRVKNSLQMVTSMVRIQRSRAQSEETRDALGETIDRLSAISQLHAELHRVSARNEIALDRFLADILRHLGANLPEGVTLDSRLVPLTVPSEIAASLALIINEAVANSVKHAFGGGSGGRITVELSVTGSTAKVVISDDGDGSVAEPDPAGRVGLGRQIIDASVSRIDGEIHRSTGSDGMSIEISFPAAPLAAVPV